MGLRNQALLARGREVAFSGLFSERIAVHGPREPFRGGRGGGVGAEDLFSFIILNSTSRLRFCKGEKHSKQHRAGGQLSQLNKGQAWPLPKGI